LPTKKSQGEQDYDLSLIKGKLPNKFYSPSDNPISCKTKIQN